MKRYLFCLILALIALPGCLSEHYLRNAEREALDIISPQLRTLDLARRKIQVVPLRRVDDIFHPVWPDNPCGPNDFPKTTPAPVETHLLTLPEALTLAAENNREIKTEWESLFRSAMSLSNVRHNFDFLLTGRASATRSGEDVGAKGVDTETLELRLRKILATGATISVAGTTNVRQDYDPFSATPNTNFSSATVTLRQPLLRGFGYKISHESLTQSERDMIYSVRRYDLLKQRIAIDVLQRYYNLVDRKNRIKNLKASLESVTFLRRRTEALYKMGRDMTEVDVLRARQDELQKENDLKNAEEDYQDRLDSMKSFLGVAIETPMDVLPDRPTYMQIEVDKEAAVQTALNNRLDLLTATDRVDDFRRGFDNARNNILPDVNLDVSASYNTDDPSGWSDQKFESRSYTAGISVEIPFDRLTQRNALQVSQLDVNLSRRQLKNFQDTVTLEVREGIRNLQRARNSLEIQRTLKKSEQRRVQVARIRFEMGQVTNRDILEAQQALLNAENAEFTALVDYEISRIRLLNRLGILMIDDFGRWEEK